MTGEWFSWMVDAACATTDPDMFTPEPGGTTKQAKRVCRSCLSRDACLEYALTTHQIGVWGGTSTKERERMRKNAA